MITLFYFLVLEQILQGFYSLWQGVEWLKMARRRLSAATGFYAPRVALICPVKGMEQDLEGNLSPSFILNTRNTKFSLRSLLRTIPRINCSNELRL